MLEIDSPRQDLKLKDSSARSPFAPFAVRSFCFQWPSDLLTSLAFEMETLILGWYVLVETRSVILLTVFGSLQYLGTLIAPMFGVVGDRFGRRPMLCSMRAFYASLALILMALGLTGLLTPYLVFAVAAPMGLVRPSDLAIRWALIGDTMPHDLLMKAIGLSRINMDVARIGGAVVGTSLFALLGIGYSYVIVASFYLASFGLTLGVSAAHVSRSEPATVAGSVPGNALLAAAASAWRDLKDGLAYVWNTPVLFAMMCLAFIANLTAYPLTIGLLPYVAREVYRIDAIGLGHIVAAYSCGALAGSITMTFAGVAKNAPRVVLTSLLLWYAALAVFVQFESKIAGMVVLVFIGFCMSLTMVSMSVALLNYADERFRARVMGARMLAIYGLPLGMLAAGVLIASAGFSGTILLYSGVGAIVTVGIGWRWRESIRR